MHKFDSINLDKLDNPERRRDMPPYETLERFGLKNIGGAVFLDIGCGIGYFTIPAAKILKGGTAIGIDVVDEMLEHAWERAYEIENVDFRKSKEYSFPVEDNSIDFALMSNVLHEVEDKVKYLLEVKRVLKAEGELYIIEWEKKETKGGPPFEHRLSKDELKEYCRKAGFSRLEEVEISDKHYGIKARF
ncbi:class I SAM-dependent methyltransferase [Fonticella tunisiensis]|uniref:Methyltransferase family protein n=1 Tax=Fonticella tunisiensis TaxID=1096341 RepID=A0A4V3ET13_9CLOT|nr:class I SAM-dependent methyltransferase [Fonticella tunisiensis]TDT57288.1 methyltransferase family protein [Fonticella tunisiensis]